ncbi:hypothetical protein BLOT_000225 [Blomia tropicalis]|nr:hypothetical protein BLOT_000225 [Blomia tropicalis]
MSSIIVLKWKKSHQLCNVSGLNSYNQQQQEYQDNDTIIGIRGSLNTIPIDTSSDQSSCGPLELNESQMVKPPDGGYGWVVVFASFMCNFTVDGICYTFGLFLPYFIEEFGSGKAITALAGSLQSGCYQTAGLFVSGLVNRFGCRPVAIVGSIVAALFLAISTFVPNVYCLILTYGIITGIFFGMIYLPSIVSVGYYFSTKRALATGIAVCGSGMGAFSFAPLVSALQQTLDWKNSLRILAGLALTCTIYGMMMKPLKSANTKKVKQLKIKSESNGMETTITVMNDNLNNDKKTNNNESNSIREIFDLSVLQIPAMALLSIANIFGMSGYYIPYFFISDYALENIYVDKRKVTSGEAAWLLSAIGITNVLGRIIFGIVADVCAGKRILGSSVKITALLINNCCLLCTALTAAAIPFCPSYWWLMVDCILFGFFISSYMSLTSIILVDLLGLNRLSTTFGLIIFCRGISAIVGPPLAGLLYQLSNSYTGVFATAGLLMLISAIVHAMVHRYER